MMTHMEFWTYWTGPMSDGFLLFIGAERFLGWVALLIVGFIWRSFAKELIDINSPWKYPAIGMEIEAYSSASYQFIWWVYHLLVMTPLIDHNAYFGLCLAFAGFCYLGCAIGAVLISRPVLYPIFGKWWIATSSATLLTVLVVGYAIGLMWIVP